MEQGQVVIYECWEGGDEVSFFSEDTKQRELNTHDVYGIPLMHRYCVRAASWNEAMSAHHAIQGWGPYSPMEDEEDD